MKNAVIFSGLVIAALAAAMVLSPVIVSAVSDFLNLKSVFVRTNPNGLDAIHRTHGLIPRDGSGGAFGYGLLTAKGLDAVIVSTTHQGVLDSEVQRNANDPAFHNHFVKLRTGVAACGTNPAVDKITFESPGKVLIRNTDALQARIPNSFTGTDALTNQPLSLDPGNNVQNAVSFKLDPKFQGSALVAVCVTDISPVDPDHLFVR